MGRAGGPKMRKRYCQQALTNRSRGPQAAVPQFRWADRPQARTNPRRCARSADSDTDPTSWRPNSRARPRTRFARLPTPGLPSPGADPHLPRRPPRPHSRAASQPGWDCRPRSRTAPP
eukprot:1877108-Alexandrium_andersonii.AAC.1